MKLSCLFAGKSVRKLSSVDIECFLPQKPFEVQLMFLQWKCKFFIHQPFVKSSSAQNMRISANIRIFTYIIQHKKLILKPQVQACNRYWSVYEKSYWKLNHEYRGGFLIIWAPWELTQGLYIFLLLLVFPLEQQCA